MFIKLNKITFYVNFNKHKLNYVICNIKKIDNKNYANIGGNLKLNRNQFAYNTTT